VKSRARGQDLQDGEIPRAQLSATDIVVQQGDQIFVFPLGRAKWSKGISMKPIHRKQSSATAKAVMP